MDLADLQCKLKVAFIVQRCGRQVIGGAEALCLQVAQRMSKYWQTEVLTTCALDYMTWANYYPEGSETVGSTSIRRFVVDHPRDVESFNALSADLVRQQRYSSIAEQEKWMAAQGPVSTALLKYLENHRADYDAFVFCGYLYATTYFGLPIVRDRAVLAPLAHDEWAIQFPMWDTFFQMPSRYVFQTEEEREFLRRRFPNVTFTGPVAGVGIEPPKHVSPERFRAKYNLRKQLLLYVGRIDVSKGCRELLEFFIRWQSEARAQYDLVLIGTEVMPIPFHESVIYLSSVSDEEKWDAMAAADWLVLPSRYESLSLALLETWATGRPAIVNGASEVLRGHCRRSQGGLCYEDWNHCRAILENVSPDEKSRLGQNGKEYVLEHYAWSAVQQAYMSLLYDNVGSDTGPAEVVSERVVGVSS
jgi:glycosyltransferase involved in cell wall biosynthesis